MEAVLDKLRRGEISVKAANKLQRKRSTTIEIPYDRHDLFRQLKKENYGSLLSKIDEPENPITLSCHRFSGHY